MAPDGTLTKNTQFALADIRFRLGGIEDWLNRRDEIRFHVLTGAMIAVMITIWVSTLLVIWAMG